ncbi:E3 ubiquitin-protein ligase MGRN1-like isoform X3 [Argiope bruennichi]|uniref:E3 ubiquitin-protein ligase MGRN1-like isoform X3 n=1 Tax=Argiope bruennichi TaxID=94029 RepID=UPI0024944034|nr:E3 ubiquitin-protein ligase MGRN1-like isoform X3 [Argiope bruennichi]
MGMIFSRQNARIEEFDSTASNAYRYPPRNGKYFASHFIMGGEKFQTTEPEMYLFGENTDLNFLGGKPAPFPYAAPQPNEPTRTLRCLINIRKESLRFVKASSTIDSEKQDTEKSSLNTLYNIEFSFDSDVRCNITIYYFCTEEVTANSVIYTPQDASLNSETYHYKKGINQQFSQESHKFDPTKYSEEMLNYRYDNEVIPVLIQCVAEEGDEPRQSHMVIAVVEKNANESYTLKPLKQKLFVDGLCYLLQEIYGIENKNVYQSDLTDEDVEDTGFDCVICMIDPRDTLILPCRHLCLCNSCADSLRYQANNCPICRAPFRALLQIKAVRKTNSTLPQISHNADNQTTQDIPPGYEPVSLIEALNGPIQPSAPLVPSFAISKALDYMLGPEMVPAPIPPFANSPDFRQKHRHLDRHHSSSVSLRLCDNSNPRKDNSSLGKLQRSVDGSSVPEVAVPSMLPSDKISLKTESLSLTRSEGKRHKKSFRTSSAPEKMRLLANSINIINDVGNKRKIEKCAELAETRSLLENAIAVEENSGATSSPKSSKPCGRSSPISLSTPHSLHLCEGSSKDTSPCGEDSDYFTPEDPSTTILVDQGTDTSLDTPQGAESCSVYNSVGKVKSDLIISGKHKVNRESWKLINNT